MTFDQFIEDVMVALNLREKSIYDLTGKKPFLCDIDEITHSGNKGFTITGKPRYLDLDTSSKNVLLCGVTGTMKSQGILIPNLLYAKPNKSIIIHDASGELRKAAAGYLQQQGFEVKVFNPLDERSNGYNPVKVMKPGLSGAKQVAQVIVNASLGSSNENNSFWNNRAESVLAILLAVTRDLPEPYQHIGTVSYLLNQLAFNPKGIDAFIAEHVKDHRLFDEYKANIASTDPKLFANIISTVQASISVFQDETVSRVLSKSDINISDARKTPMAIFLESSVMRSSYTAPVFSLMLYQFMEYLLSDIPSKEELPVMLLLDEFPVLHITGFQQFIANSRKHAVSTLISCQSDQQILAKFGFENGKAIMGNCGTHVYFNNAPLESSESISKKCGTVEMENETGKINRPLFKSEEVRLIPKDRVLIHTAGHRPILAHIRPAFKSRKLKRRNHLPFDLKAGRSKNGLVLLPDIPIIRNNK